MGADHELTQDGILTQSWTFVNQFPLLVSSSAVRFDLAYALLKSYRYQK